MIFFCTISTLFYLTKYMCDMHVQLNVLFSLLLAVTSSKLPEIHILSTFHSGVRDNEAKGERMSKNRRSFKISVSQFIFALKHLTHVS